MTHPQALSMEKHLKDQLSSLWFFGGGVVYCRALGTICQGLFGPTCTQRGARLLGNITSGTMGLGHPWTGDLASSKKNWRKWSNQKQLVWFFLEVDRNNNNNNNNNNREQNDGKMFGPCDFVIPFWYIFLFGAFDPEIFGSSGIIIMDSKEKGANRDDLPTSGFVEKFPRKTLRFQWARM